MNYYNEFDKNAAAWLRELIADNLQPLRRSRVHPGGGNLTKEQHQ